MSDERTRRVAPVEKRTPNEHCARECDSFLPIVSSCRRDEVYSEWMGLVARHYYDFLTRRCQFIDVRLDGCGFWCPLASGSKTLGSTAAFACELAATLR